MKKYIVLSLLFLSSAVLADVPAPRKVVAESTYKATVTPLVDNIKMCKPYNETLDTNVSGVDFNFKIKILGWDGDKCRLDFEAKSTGLSNMFASITGLDASQSDVFVYSPKAKCAFTKQQLLSVGDSILQEDARNRGAVNNMLKNPNDITLDNFSQKDLDLMDIVFRQGACNVDFGMQNY